MLFLLCVLWKIPFFPNRPHRINSTEARWAQIYHTQLQIWHNVRFRMRERERKRNRNSQEALLEWLPRSWADEAWSVGAWDWDLKSVLDPLRRASGIRFIGFHEVVVPSAVLQTEHISSTWMDEWRSQLRWCYGGRGNIEDPSWWQNPRTGSVTKKQATNVEYTLCKWLIYHLNPS